ncbi:MAG: hypothetical protein HN742_32805 [Lentisphaerae bacterium]|jgi:hypothetical protein|nr:hypothetical protein [Lentisphaerota bacterium]MBT4822607.1 hypothetical protein [Lentisphaerota bacterium]MBT5610911.1 hypothetical protein [Lentisphaerota bacterium]MBT7055908.1 hypothetical protein [Lentisphaerota bacterium]MBT7846697.1 hypothetical protein [Lentisphaerota bacterium]
MSAEALLMSVIAFSLGLYYVAKWVHGVPVPPDPWENDIPADELVETAPELLCENCLSPRASPDQHYCPTCGNATGDFTRYIPFVNIRFNYSLLPALWRKLTSTDEPLRSRIIALLVLLLIAPAMLAVGVPFLLYAKLWKKPDEPAKEPAPPANQPGEPHGG